MNGISGQDHPSALIFVGDQRQACLPGLGRQHLHRDFLSNDAPDIGTRVQGCRILTRFKFGPGQKMPLAIQRNDGRAAFGVHGMKLPRCIGLHDVVQRGGVEIDRQHLAHHKVHFLARFAVVLDTETAPHRTASAIAPDQIAAGNGFNLAGIDVLDFDRHAVIPRRERNHLPAKTRIDGILRIELFLQDAFDKHLRGPLQRLRADLQVERARGQTFAHAGNSNSANFMRVDPGYENRVAAMIYRKPDIAHPTGDA